ncbi:hypothetical protein PENTCL1PPCAC_3999, partial [Pristionchus entomophagus]
ECMELAEELSTKNFSSSKRQVTCFSYPFTNGLILIDTTKQELSTNGSCKGDICYMSSYNRREYNRGCLTVVHDSLSMTKIDIGGYQYFLLHFYLCEEDYCTREDL